jgi:hypothetical protein
MATKFSFDNAAFHFARTDGPPGFIWKYLACFGIGALLLMGIGYYTFQPLIDPYVEMFSSLMDSNISQRAAEDAFANAIVDSFGQVAIGTLLLVLFYAVFWSVMEAAILRRYIRDEGFSIGFGADELRMLAVGVIWYLSFMGMYLVFILAMMGLIAPVATIAQDNPGLIALWTIIVVPALMVVWLYVVVRLSPAGAMTIRDRKIKFFSAWSLTKGRFWPTLGAFAVLGLILYLIAMVIYMVVGFTLIGSIFSAVDFSSGEPDPEAIFAALASSGTITGLAIGYFLMLLVQGFSQYAWAGVPALVAKTDPRIGGRTFIADEFN